jgi:hypothetical protein
MQRPADMVPSFQYTVFQYTVYVHFRQSYQIRITDDSRQFDDLALSITYPHYILWMDCIAKMAESGYPFVFPSHQFIKRDNDGSMLASNPMRKTLFQLISCQIPLPKPNSSLNSVSILSTATNISNLSKRPLLSFASSRWRGSEAVEGESVYLRVLHDSEENDSEYTTCHCAS